MSRFQAQTNTVLDQELDDLRHRLGLRPNQKAALLREVAALAAWVVKQTEAGRAVEARRGTDIEPLAHPILARLRDRAGSAALEPITLTETEVERLARILDRPFSPTPALRHALTHLANPRRRPPRLRWRKRVA